jgi:hypothetical protein
VTLTITVWVGHNCWYQPWTSWLPARTGLGALSTMIFAPQVEVRHNAKKTRLTGFVAGLGPKFDVNVNNKPGH